MDAALVKKFVLLVSELRTNQRAFFAGNKSVIRNCKALEFRVDQQLKSLLDDSSCLDKDNNTASTVKQLNALGED